ncbi:MAG TPA: excisionase family DNA-binding protein [Dermatophilaceae bacterium]|nr:excisionase family DNA-binding protein [Dermatophilaceae bacterium]
MAVETGVRRVLTTEREAEQARSVLDDLRGPEGALSVERAGRRVAPLPPEVGRILQQVLDVMAAGGTVTVGMIPDEVTTSTAAGMLGVSRPTLMKMIKEGSIPSHKVGTHHRLKAEDVRAARRARRARERAAFDALRDEDDRMT